MSFYDPHSRADGFPIDLASTSDVLQRFHRTLMDRRQEVDWLFDGDAYPAEMLEQARLQWSQRASAEYQSTAQFAQLLYRLTLIGAPLELIGAATRLATDECRHAELCGRFAEVLGGCDVTVTNDGLSLYEEDELAMACAMTVLTVCCFGETLSVPMLRALVVVSTDPLAERISNLIAVDEEYHARFGWEALAWFCGRMSEIERQEINTRLPSLMGHFERVCHGSPDTFERLVGSEFEVEEGEANLGTLPSDGYASIFYATIEDTIIPQLTALGFDALRAWQHRVVPA